MQTVRRALYGVGLTLATSGFIRGYNAREYKTKDDETVTLLHSDENPLIIDRTIGGIFNGMLYVFPPYCIINAVHSLARLEIALTKKDPMKYKNCYKEFCFISTKFYRFPNGYEKGDYQKNRSDL